MDNGHARERMGGGVGGAGANSGAVCGWTGVSASVGGADAGDASEGEEVRLIRQGAGTDEAGCDAPLVQGSRSIVLDEWDGGKDGVSD
jgi:hypothetical protein